MHIKVACIQCKAAKRDPHKGYKCKVYRLVAKISCNTQIYTDMFHNVNVATINNKNHINNNKVTLLLAQCLRMANPQYGYKSKILHINTIHNSVAVI